MGVYIYIVIMMVSRGPNIVISSSLTATQLGDKGFKIQEIHVRRPAASEFYFLAAWGV